MATITETTDAATGLDTIYTISVGDTFAGSVAGSDEVDRVLIDLVAGESYTVTLTGLYGGTSQGVVAVANFDAGVQSWTVGYADGGAVGQIATTVTDTGSTWQIAFVAPVTGQYSLFVDDNGDPLADAYTMSLVSNAPAVPTSGDDSLTGTPGPDTINLLGGNDSYAGLDGDDDVQGATGDDSIQGEGGNDTLKGGQGDDTALGGDGADLLFGLSGADVLDGGAGDDTLRGGDNDDRLSGGADHDLVLGDVGDDRVAGDMGQDTLRGGAGNDTLLGGADNDTLLGDGGNDRILGAGGHDLARGGAGNDDLRGGGGYDTLRGDAGDDTVIGDGGADRLLGNAGNDSLRGDNGADTLTGGDGTDTLTGGTGADTFVMAAGSTDLVTDFETGIDTLDLRGFGAGILWSARSDDAGGTIVAVDGADVAVLAGIDPETLGASDIRTRPGSYEATITFDGGTVAGGTYSENGFVADWFTFAFQTTAQDPFQDLDGDGDLDFGVTDDSAAVTNIDAFAWIEFAQASGDTFDFVAFALTAAGGSDLDGNLILTGNNDSTGYLVTATLNEAGDGLWDVQTRANASAGFVSANDQTEAQMLAAFTDLDRLYIRSADGDGRQAVDTGNGIGIDDLVFI